MASLKDIRIRIASVKSTRKITGAMKVVSAAKFHKAQDQQARFQNYCNRFRHTLAQALAQVETHQHVLLQSVEPDAPVALLVFSSNSSLCGAYNQNVGVEAKRRLALLRGEGHAVDVYAYGKKVIEILRREGIGLVVADEQVVDKPSFASMATLYEQFQSQFEAGRYSRIEVVYNGFVNPATQVSTCTQLLPVQLDLDRSFESKGYNTEYIIEPTPKEFLDFALPVFARLILSGCILDNYVGEHGARMTAMSQATDNANNLVNDLTLEYNKARQAAITNEILEIVSGANAQSNG